MGDDGRVWDVWPVWPQVGNAIGVRQEYAEGWLAFRSGTDRLRFAPVPDHWETMSEAEMRLCLAAAHAPEQSRLANLTSRGVPRD